uniref:Protein ALP1-like isoform X1 n=1 Tax=Tanacetum cinerariifolium TaxID=118510 RepID=A0A6L2NL05_TANCI|nr:protein ALP1-like isoform X1 [Tanacetum cinerariifolium]
MVTHLMYTCIILHTMIPKEKGKAISLNFYPEAQHREDDPVRSTQDRLLGVRSNSPQRTGRAPEIPLINVLYQSPLFNDLKTGRAPEIPFVANGVTYPSGYYLVDGIYPELAPLVKTIPEPGDDDHKRILYKQKQESARKDVERAFGVLKKK